MRVYQLLLLASCSIGALSVGATAVSITEMSKKSTKKSNDWIIDAENDQVRFTLIQRYLRGFDQPMWEVGERYQSVYDALQRNNFELAEYHWKKIRKTIQNGYLKRPKRQQNADAIFLDTGWRQALVAFQSRDIQQAWQGFEQAKQACMACHIAEKVPFMNKQPLFELPVKNNQ